MVSPESNFLAQLVDFCKGLQGKFCNPLGCVLSYHKDFLTSSDLFVSEVELATTQLEEFLALGFELSHKFFENLCGKTLHQTS